MPAESLPVVIVVVSMFATFMAVVGFVSIWSNLTPRKATPARAPRFAGQPQVAR